MKTLKMLSELKFIPQHGSKVSHRKGKMTMTVWIYLLDLPIIN